MPTLLLAYDLNAEKDEEARRRFLGIRNTYNYIQLSESSYALETNETPQEVLNKLQPFIDNDDRVYIVKYSDKNVLNYLPYGQSY